MAGYEDKVERIEKLASKDKVSQPIKVDLELESRVAPNKDQFDIMMGHGQPKSPEVEVEASRRIESSKVSLADEIAKLSRRTDQIGRTPPDMLVAQAQEVMTKIDELKGKLNTPNLEIKGSFQNLLSNKLSHIDESLKVALSKAGIEYKAPAVGQKKSNNPIERFLGMLTDAQARLETMANDVTSMNDTKKEITPVAMLTMQVKVGFVQQELEFFTGLLNKCLESTKTIMNVQV